MENGTQSHSVKFLNWGDPVNSVPDLAASPPSPPGLPHAHEIETVGYQSSSRWSSAKKLVFGPILAHETSIFRLQNDA